LTLVDALGVDGALAGEVKYVAMLTILVMGQISIL